MLHFEPSGFLGDTPSNIPKGNSWKLLKRWDHLVPKMIPSLSGDCSKYFRPNLHPNRLEVRPGEGGGPREREVARPKQKQEVRA